MKAPTLKSQGHSAQVRMELRLNGRVLPIAQMGPDFLIIDDAESSWRVHLVEGLSKERRKTKVTPLL
jgi:hypothetical protein